MVKLQRIWKASAALSSAVPSNTSLTLVVRHKPAHQIHGKSLASIYTESRNIQCIRPMSALAVEYARSRRFSERPCATVVMSFDQVHHIKSVTSAALDVVSRRIMLVSTAGVVLPPNLPRQIYKSRCTLWKPQASLHYSDELWSRPIPNKLGLVFLAHKRWNGCLVSSQRHYHLLVCPKCATSASLLSSCSSSSHLRTPLRFRAGTIMCPEECDCLGSNVGIMLRPPRAKLSLEARLLSLRATGVAR